MNPLKRPGANLKVLPIFLLIVSGLLAQDRKVDPTWLHRYVPRLSGQASLSSPCQLKPIFGEGDPDSHTMISVARFAEVTVAPRGNCPSESYDRQEEIYFVLKGSGTLHYGDQTYSWHANDFTYIPPAVKHSVENNSAEQLEVLVMGFKIPARIAIAKPAPEAPPQSPPKPKIVNLDAVQEETVEGHPTSVLYKLLVGPSTGKRDAIDQAYVVTSLFWMNFAPGGTNFPHHHPAAEEIYLVLDGNGDMVAGGGVDGIEGRHPAATGDAYYFRPNCTVGFYNQNKPGIHAHILAVRSRIPRPDEDD